MFVIPFLNVGLRSPFYRVEPKQPAPVVHQPVDAALTSLRKQFGRATPVTPRASRAVTSNKLRTVTKCGNPKCRKHVTFPRKTCSDACRVAASRAKKKAASMLAA